MTTPFEVRAGDLVWATRIDKPNLSLHELRYLIYANFRLWATGKPDPRGKVKGSTSYQPFFPLLIRQDHTIHVVSEEQYDKTRKDTGNTLLEGQDLVNQFLGFTNPKYLDDLLHKAGEGIAYEKKNPNRRDPTRARVNRTEKIQCACGGSYTYTNKGKHILTTRHRDYEAKQS